MLVFPHRPNDILRSRRPGGRLNAITLNTVEYARKIPLGEYRELAAKGMTNTSTDNCGEPLVTTVGLVSRVR